ncbi:NAD-dependent epimerase/dehydratase family protein [Pelagovum pacificum]|uniref:NAD-dependent epimerase/dehydratase family protein n=1 Tax=Pelagovum pacificum TaxID=2588711 RepID=UPI0022B10A6B|nr:SDR family oxidoreductase [Pelagovum pacificum]
MLGATGRIGSMLVRHWSEAPPTGAEIVPQARRARTGHVVWDPLSDVCPVKADVVVGLAGVTPGPGAEFGLNVDLGLAAVRTAEEAGARRLLLASTSAIYGPARNAPEDAAVDPPSDYGASKLAMERAVASESVETCCLRIGNVAWADALLGRLQPGKPVMLDQFADGGGPVRSYLGPRTLARVIESLARVEGALPKVLNVGGPDPVTMESLLLAAGVPWEWQPAPPTAVQHVTLDCSKLAALHGFASDATAPEVLIAEGRGLKGGA